MTKDWYITHGYKMSAAIDDAEITRAENDVTDAYITPIVGTANVPQETKEKTIGALAFLLLLQRSVFLTRGGAKIKSGYNSYDADAWAILQQEAQSCHLALETLRAQDGVNKDAEIIDICKIYFKSNFISL